jgi:hypothetical protein
MSANTLNAMATNMVFAGFMLFSILLCSITAADWKPTPITSEYRKRAFADGPGPLVRIDVGNPLPTRIRIAGNNACWIVTIIPSRPGHDLHYNAGTEILFGP